MTRHHIFPFYLPLASANEAPCKENSTSTQNALAGCSTLGVPFQKCAICVDFVRLLVNAFSTVCRVTSVRAL